MIMKERKEKKEWKEGMGRKKKKLKTKKIKIKITVALNWTRPEIAFQIQNINETVRAQIKPSLAAPDFLHCAAHQPFWDQV